MRTATTGNQRWIPRYVQRRVRRSVIYIVLSFAFIAFLVGVYQGGIHLVELEADQVTLRDLPSALTLSFFRMLASYLGSIVFAFILGLVAARTRLGERFIIPLLDILQSVPVVGFFTAAITFFIGLTNEHRMGVELAAVFLIFTSMAWNLAFAIYEVVKSIPQDKLDAIMSFGIRGSQRFWKLYAPACVPRLVYNSILSWSNGWFFLVACEIIAVGPMRYDLPGIGSFLARAAEQDQVGLVLWGLLALTTLVLLLDYLVWRPATVWSERFRTDSDSSTSEYEPVSYPSLPQSLFSKLAPLGGPTRRMAKAVARPIEFTISEILLPLLWDLPAAILSRFIQTLYNRVTRPAVERWTALVDKAKWIEGLLFWTILGAVGVWAVVGFWSWFQEPWPELASEIPFALLVSTGRLILALLLSMAWVLPLILLVWNRPKLRQTLTTIAQVGASLPAIALFPLIILFALRYLGGGMEFASILLLLTGMQWYLLFNCLGAASTIPTDIAEATRSFGLKASRTWLRLVFPAIRPALVTGSITAWGAGWNALVVAEYVTFKDEILTVNGIGALLSQAVYQIGDHRTIMICVGSMVAWILILNVAFWQPLYRFVIERYRFER